MTTSRSDAPIVRLDRASGRFYRHTDTGRELVSVTTALGVISKPALVTWASNLERELVMEAAADLYTDVSKIAVSMSRPSYLATLQRRLGDIKAHKRASDKACEIGGQAHNLIEWSIKKALGYTVGPEPKVSDEAMWAYMAFEDWARTHDVRPILIEQQVWSLTHGYAGTLDLLARVDGQVMLVDFKTSKGIYAEYGLQNVAYQVALAEMGHHRAEGGLIVRIPKNVNDPAFEVATVDTVDALFPTFQAVLALFDWWYAEDQKSKAAWKARRDAAKAKGAAA